MVTNLEVLVGLIDFDVLGPGAFQKAFPVRGKCMIFLQAQHMADKFL